MTTPQDIATYLQTLPHVRDVQPITLTIHGVSYPAARYCTQMTTPEHSPAWQRGERSYTQEMIYVAGIDFWLTRNGHGAGFWDRGLGDVGTRLTCAAHNYGSVDLYAGDDGLIYG